MSRRFKGVRILNIQWAGTPNYTPGRQCRKIIAIVDHITAGLMPGCLSWMRNPAAKASAHYLITRAGVIYQLVKEADTAWHAGEVKRPSWRLYDGTNPNRYTIGIEHEGKAGDALTEAQYQATLWLHRQLVQKYGIPADQDYIIGHYRIDSVNRPNCPGPGFPWGRLFADLKGGNGDMKVGMEIPEVKVTMQGKVAEKSVILTVDGKDTTYIPAVVLREHGYRVDWDAATASVTIKKG